MWLPRRATQFWVGFVHEKSCQSPDGRNRTSNLRIYSPPLCLLSYVRLTRPLLRPVARQKSGRAPPPVAADLSAPFTRFGTGWCPRATQALKSATSVDGVVSEAPSDLRYAPSHEWIRIDGDEATIGITDHAQDALNDVVYVVLPAVGDHIDQGQKFGEVESVKSVSDVYLPVTGEVTEINDMLEDTPETINEDPYGDGWLVRIKLAQPDEAESLLNAADYLASLE
jgi:glycine cleavage system H protein